VILISTGLMLIIVPVIALTLLFCMALPQGQHKADYRPDWDHSTQLELVIWAAPLLIIALGAITWISTHELDPYRPSAALTPSASCPKHQAAGGRGRRLWTGNGCSSTNKALRWSTSWPHR
jgi:cytochrome o ubiquinol oxidase subunit 2